MWYPLRRLVNNLGIIVLALLMAFVVWIVATLQDDPFTDQEIPGVPLTVVNQPQDTVFIDPIAEQVAVTVRAPQSVVAELGQSDFEATMDLAGVETGSPATVPIQVTTQNEAVRILSWEPQNQAVSLEAVRTISLPVEIDVQGRVATGYQALTPVMTPDQVAVTGPESLLAQVTSVGGSVDVGGAREDVSEQVAVRPLDAQGKLVAGLQWTPDRVDVQMGVRRRLGYKPDVEVVPDLRGDPAPGYRLGSVSVEPSTVTLAGLPSVLDELPGFMETQPISVTGAIQDLLEFSRLTVPDNVVVVGVDYVTVTVEVLAIQSSKAMTASVDVQGVRPGWVATASPGVVDVILEGPDTVLATLTPDDIRVTVDLFNYSLGVHRIDPDVLAPAEVTVVSIIPETIEVQIAPAPTPTPTLTVTPTVTVRP